MGTPRAPHAEDDEPLGMRWTAGRVVVVIAVLAMVGFWAWIFAGGPKKANPDRLDDRAWVDRAKDRCAQLIDDIDALPNPADIDSASERADVLDRATDEVEGAVADLRKGAPTDGDDGKSLTGWFSDWEQYVEDRRDYADRLRKDADARFYVSENERLHATVDETIETFADVNDMPDCATPGDVG